MTSSGSSETLSARYVGPGRLRDDVGAAAVGQVHVEQHDVGRERAHLGHGVGDVRGLPHELHVAFELGAHAGAEQLVVVDEQDPDHNLSSTSVPSPGVLWTAALPPWRAMRPTIDSAMPRRSGGTSSGVEARGRGRARRPRPRRPSPRRRPRPEWAGRDVAGVLGGVDHRLACRGDERLRALVEVAVAHGDDLDRDAVRALDLARRRPRARRAAAASRPPPRGRRARRAARAPASGRARRPRAGPPRASARARASAGPSRAGARRPPRAPASGCAAERSAVSDRTSRRSHGPRITASARATTSATSSTSRIAPSETVVRRKTAAAATTRTMPSPVRETADAARAARSAGSGSAPAWRRRAAARAPRAARPPSPARCAR